MGEVKSFDRLKTALKVSAQKPLTIIDWNKMHQIFVDASSHTVAGALPQLGHDGQESPVAFFSWKLSEAQQKWPIVEKEAFAALKTLNRVKVCICEITITVWSDQNPLTYLTEYTPKSPRLLRWSLAVFCEV